MNHSQKYPNIKNLLGLLHQDWKLMFEWEGNQPDYKAAIRKLNAESEQEVRRKYVAELQDLVNLNYDEDLLREIVNRSFRSAFYPPGIGLSYQQWLEEILKLLREPNEKAKKEFLPKIVGE